MKRSASNLIKSESRECSIELISINKTKFAIVHMYYLTLIDVQAVEFTLKANDSWSHSSTSTQTANFEAFLPFLHYFYFVSIKTLSTTSMQQQRVQSVMWLSLEWTVRLFGKNCYALCHLFYICNCKINVSRTRNVCSYLL